MGRGQTESGGGDKELTDVRRKKNPEKTMICLIGVLFIVD